MQQKRTYSHEFLKDFKKFLNFRLSAPLPIPSEGLFATTTPIGSFPFCRVPLQASKMESFATKFNRFQPFTVTANLPILDFWEGPCYASVLLAKWISSKCFLKGFTIKKFLPSPYVFIFSPNAGKYGPWKL